MKEAGQLGGEEQLLSFIASSFRSVWALEVLRFLVRGRDRGFSAEELITELRVSSSVIAQSLDQLEAVALVLATERGLMRFQPADSELEGLALDTIGLYERRPDLVRRTIVSQTSPGITAFSNAFKLRKE